jgi:hypothetical protein
MSDGRYIGLTRKDDAMKPTIGRIVLFRSCGLFPRMVDYDPKQPMSAQVAYVWSDNCVNLAVTDHAGNQHQVTSVHLHQGDGPCSSAPYCEWMPYQKSVAKGEIAPHSPCDRQ